ncbi:MAG: ATP-dependent DNA helicase UvrD/PcrA, partial [uncultured Chloroflexia bacterium]
MTIASTILSTLNEPQQRAVQTMGGPVLVLAGPGSGKTRVLTHRVAYLISEKRVDPYNILAVTFTNKAAKEMKERLNVLIGDELTKRLTVGTFHSVCV